MSRSLAGGLGLLVLSLFYIWGATRIPHSALSDEVGARGMPLLLGGALAVISIAICVQAWVARAAVAPAEKGEASLPRVAGVLACAGLYILVAWLLGYIFATGVTLLAVSIYEGAPVNLRTFLTALGGAAVFWLVFVKFLGVAQPAGLLFGG